MEKSQEKLKSDLMRLLNGFETAVKMIKTKLESDELITPDFINDVQDVANKPMTDLFFEHLDEMADEDALENYESDKYESNIIHDDGFEPEEE